MEKNIISIEIKTTRICKDCGNYFRISSFSKDSKCPNCLNYNTESAYKNFDKKSKKEQDRIREIIIDLQKKDLIARANKQKITN